MKTRIKTPSNSWATPQDFYDKLNNRFSFINFDPCPIEFDFDPEINKVTKLNGLINPWPVGNVFVNPPYDLKNKTDFSWKAYHHWVSGKCESAVLLLPVSTSSHLFHHLFLPKAIIEFLPGRLLFEGLDNQGNWCNPNKGRNMEAWRNRYLLPGQAGIKRSGQFDSMLVIFGNPMIIGD